MNTTSVSIPILPQTGGYVYALEDLELAFNKKQLSQITMEWNNGKDIKEIASKHKRDPDEVFLGLFHQARNGNVIRPFAYQIS